MIFRCRFKWWYFCLSDLVWLSNFDLSSFRWFPLVILMFVLSDRFLRNKSGIRILQRQCDNTKTGILHVYNYLFYFYWGNPFFPLNPTSGISDVNRFETSLSYFKLTTLPWLKLDAGLILIYLFGATQILLSELFVCFVFFKFRSYRW